MPLNASLLSNDILILYLINIIYNILPFLIVFLNNVDIMPLSFVMTMIP